MTTVTDVRNRMTDGGAGRYTTDPAAIVGIAIHHSVSGGQFFTAATLTADDEINHLRMIDAYHASKGWGGFGYHAAAFPSGNGYICGAWGGARAHVASRNDVLLGVVLVGDFTARTPPLAQLAAARALVALADEHVGRILALDGHRAWALPTYPTACPGDTWQAWLPQLYATQEDDDMDEPTVRALVRDELRRMGITSTTPPTPGTRSHTVGAEGAKGLWGVWQATGNDAPWAEWHSATTKANGWPDGASPVIHIGDVIQVPA